MLDYVAVYEDQFGDRRALEIQHKEFSDLMRQAESNAAFDEGLLLCVPREDYEKLVQNKTLPRLL